MAAVRAPDRLGGEDLRLPASLWAATAIAPPPVEPLAGDVRADIAIVGAGFLGLSAALHLAEAGAKVVVVDAAEPGWGASGRNNGQVIPGLKHDPDEIERLLGPEIGGRLVAWSGRAPSLVFDLIERHGIACFPVHKGWIQPAYTANAVRSVEERCAQWAARGADVAMVPKERLSDLLGTPTFHAGWIDRRGGSIQPLSYARGLAAAALGAGARIHGGTMVRRLSRLAEGWQLDFDHGRVDAKQVVVATNAYGDLLPELRRALIPVRTAQVATEPLTDNVLRTILPERQPASDTRNLLTSFRISPDGRLVMGGSGATGGAEREDLMRHLHRSAAEIFGHLGELRWEFGWSGYLALTADHLPHIYEPAPGLIAGIGCNGRGIAVSTGLGKLIAERILGRAAEDLDVPITGPRAFPFHAFRNLGIATATHWKRWHDRRDRRAAAAPGP